jgi:hypothetical protein
MRGKGQELISVAVACRKSAGAAAANDLQSVVQQLHVCAVHQAAQ